jgi:hypothetical protein
VSTRLFFVSIWMAGTVAASSLGWTAVALVAQRVGDQPNISYLESLSPAGANAAVSNRSAESATNEARSTTRSFYTAAELATPSPSTELIFDAAWAVADPEIPVAQSVPSVPKADGPVLGATPVNAVRSAFPPVGSNQVIPKVGEIAKPSKSPRPPESQEISAIEKNNADRATPTGSASAAAIPEIHANPGKVFGVSSASTKPAPFGSPSEIVSKQKSAKAARPPIPLAPSPKVDLSSTVQKRTEQPLTAGAIPADQPQTENTQAPAAPVPTAGPSLAALAETPITLTIAAPPIPLSPSPSASLSGSTPIGAAPLTLAPPVNPAPIAPNVVAVPAISATIPATSIAVYTSAPAPQTTPPTATNAPTSASSTALPTAAPTFVTTTTKLAAVVQQAYQLTNGSVGVHCIGNRIVLDFATPSPGASAKVENSGPEKIELTFKSSGGESENSKNETEFSARCVGGIPSRGN